MTPFVPDGFVPPAGLDVGAYRLEPLSPEHTESDYAAWTSSMDHIRATPGFETSSWPHEMSLADNTRDLERHAADFTARIGFTYTFLAPDRRTVVGCVYIYPSDAAGVGARIRSWVRAVDAELDPILYRAVRDWLDADWPFARIEYAARPGA